MHESSDGRNAEWISPQRGLQRIGKAAFEQPGQFRVGNGTCHSRDGCLDRTTHELPAVGRGTTREASTRMGL